MTDLADVEVLPARWRRWLPLVGITALAAALRIFALGNVPPGLYHDEAFNGLDALHVLQGQWPTYFAANHGREPLFIYFIAATVGVLGRTPGALRLAASICGTLTVPATFLMARAWFNRRVALLSATVLSGMLWHVHLSRVGFRAVTMPLATALALWSAARAFRSRRRRDWLIAGLLYGLGFYTYLPVRFTPLVLALFVVYLLLAGRGDRLWPGVLYFALGALAPLAPLGGYVVSHWDVAMGRPGQVSIFNPQVNGGDPWGTLGRQLLDTLGMFFVRGDSIPRHNLPGRPVFDPLLGAALIVGVVEAVRRRDAPSILTLAWIGAMLVPTWLAIDAPHFLRAVGVLPLLVVLPALGLEAAMTWLERRGPRRRTVVLVVAILAFGVIRTGRDYFVRYARDPETAYAFETAATELAAEINRFTGMGWDGRGLAASRGRPIAGRKVLLDKRLWDAWTALPFLVPESEALDTFSRTAVPAPKPDEKTLLLLWPYDGVAQYLTSLPRNVRIEAHAGPLTRGDFEDGPYAAYAAYTITPGDEQPREPLARFDDQIALVDYGIERDGQTWQVQLTWEAFARPSEDYVAFVYLCDGRCQGGRLIAQDDGEPGDGYYPTGLWRRGDLVVDTHTLELPAQEKEIVDPQLGVGFYAWPSLERLEVARPSGERLGDMFVLSVGPES